MILSPHDLLPSRARDLAWQLWLDRTPRPGWQNMALDMALHARAARSGAGYLRLYRWNPSCLSFGRHEPAARRYDRHRIEQLGLDTVRRPTGGRAVWHASELTYAVAAPEAAMGSLRIAYYEIHRTIAQALESMGAPVRLAPAGRALPVDAGACFACAAGGEVVVGDGKVVGSAQLRAQGALLQHGSILLQDDQAQVGDISLGHVGRAHVRPLSMVLEREVDWDEVARAVADAALPWGESWDSLEGEAVLIAEAEALAPRFRDPAWTWQR